MTLAPAFHPQSQAPIVEWRAHGKGGPARASFCLDEVLTHPSARRAARMSQAEERRWWLEPGRPGDRLHFRHYLALMWLSCLSQFSPQKFGMINLGVRIREKMHALLWVSIILFQALHVWGPSDDHGIYLFLENSAISKFKGNGSYFCCRNLHLARNSSL